MSVIGSNVLAGASGGAGAAGYQIDRSLRFNSADSAYLNRTPSSAGNRKTWTWSGWVKRSTEGNVDHVFNADGYTLFYFFSDHKLDFDGGGAGAFSTARAFRDYSAWYHIVLAFDTTQATESNRIKLWVNGEQVQEWDSITYPAQNAESAINGTGVHKIGHWNTQYANFYLADVYFLDNQAVDPTAFAEFDANNVWQAKEFTGSFTTSGVSFDFLEQQLYAGGTREALFDGSTSTGCNFQKTSASSSSTAPSNTKRIKVTFPTAKTGVTKLRIYGGGNSSSTNRVWYNDDESTMITNNDPVGWKTVYTGYAITINSISFGTSDGGSNLRAIEINDVVLTDAVEQGINSFHLPFSDNSSAAALGTDSSGNNNDWTVNNLTAIDPPNYADPSYFSVGNSTINNPSNAFDGSTSTQATCNYTATPSNDWLQWSYSITANTSMRFFIAGFPLSQNISINGLTPVTPGGSGRWLSLADVYPGGSPTFPFDFTSIRVAPASNSRNGRLSAVEVDGVVLVSGSGGPGSDSLIDTPSNYEAEYGNNGGNYCTWNRIDSTGSNTLTNGNLDSSGAKRGNRGTISLTSGKFYYETVISTSAAGGDFGWSKSDEPCPTTDPGANSYGWSIHTSGVKRHNGSTSSYISGGLAVGDVIQFAIDVDAGKVWFGKNNTWGASGDPAAGTNAAFTNVTGPIAPAHGNGGSNIAFSSNFGQRPFAYTPPTGFKSLCTTNLPDPTIADGSTAFDVSIWSGNSTQDRKISTAFSPDFVWVKRRNAAKSHILIDAIRGDDNYLHSDTTNANQVQANLLGLVSDGYELGTVQSVNLTGNTYVGWAWYASESNTSISPGSLNSSAYNQSAVWSSMCSPTPSINTFASGFDGSTATTFRGGISAGSYFTFTPTGGITFTDKVRVYNGNVSGASYKYNNGSATSFPTNSWTTVATGGGTMTSFAVTRNTTAVHGWFAIEVDGRILVDQGATPAANFPSISSTVRANPSAGFSIVSYTGNGTPTIANSIGHGLNATPELIIVKNRDNTIQPYNWAVFHKDLIDGSTVRYLRLNTTDGQVTGSGHWRNTPPTSSVFYVGNDGPVNNSGDDYIAYCFTPVEGYSAFGSYTGNGSTDGPFIYTGMRPRFILQKRTDTAGSSWQILDTERDPFNLMNSPLLPESNSAEVTADRFDSLSNGFKIRTSNGGQNASGGSFIYAAFAEHPFKTARAR
jgi:hypothetical protein